MLRNYTYHSWTPVISRVLTSLTVRSRDTRGAGTLIRPWGDASSRLAALSTYPGLHQPGLEHENSYKWPTLSLKLMCQKKGIYIMSAGSETMRMRAEQGNVAVLLEHARGFHCKASCSKIPRKLQRRNPSLQVALACLGASPPPAL